MSDGPEVTAGVAEPGDMSFDEAYASLEAPDPQAPAPEADPAAPAPTPEPTAAPPEGTGPARDDQGRFIKKDAAPTGEPTEADASPADTPPEPVPTDEQASTSEAADKADAPEESLPEVTFTADGRSVNIPGSKVGDDGWFIPASQIPQTTRLLQQGVGAAKAARDFGQKLAEARREGQTEVEQARALLQKIANLRGDKAKAKAWVENVFLNDQAWEAELLKAENEALKKSHETVDATRQEERLTREAEALRPKLSEAVSWALGEFAKQDAYKAVPTDTLPDRLLHMPGVFHEVQQGTDLPAGVVVVQRYEDGTQVVMDTRVVERELADRATLVERVRTTATQQAAVRKVNAPVVKPPAPASGKKPAAPAQPKQPPKLETAQDADSYFFGEGFKDL